MAIEKKKHPGTRSAAALRARIAELEELLAARGLELADYSQRLEAAREEAEQQRRLLRYSEARLSSILEASLDAVFFFDTHGLVLEWNPQAEFILGWSREQALGQTVDALRVPLPHANSGKGIPTLSTSVDDLLLDQRVEATAIHRDGWDFPVELAVARLGSGSDAIFTTFLRDITVRKESQEELTVARDGALAVSRMKSEFLATMSHEIRTPMNGVVGMAELLLSTKLTSEQHNYAEAILGSAEGLLTVLSDIIDFSGIEIGQFSLESIPFDLRQVVEESADLLAPKATQKYLDLAVDYDPDAPTGFMGDPGRLRQILTNLIGNAVKFTQAGHVAVRVTSEHHTETAARMTITIEDTGVGMDANTVEHVFEDFPRADSSRTRRGAGMGLGLPITKRLVEMMHGSIHVESERGKGSTFYLRLELPRDPRATAPAVPASALAGLRVLVVDESETNRTVVRDLLSANRVVACVTSAGQQALAALRAAHDAGAPFDIALIDYHLPDTEGEALALEIKSDPTLASTVLVAVTSVAGQRYASRMLMFGFAAIVVKPVRPSQLFRALARARSYLHHTEVPGTDRAAGASAPPPAAGIPSYRARVLVAEDSMVNQKVVTRMLEKLNCAVDLAADGKQAATMAETIRYDLIFMDCHMPEMDGFEATAIIRSRPAEANTPIIALTADAMQGDRERCLKAGMNDYLAKPIKVSDLADALQRWSPSPATRNR